MTQAKVTWNSAASARDEDGPDAVDLIIRQWATARPELDVSAMAIFGRLHRAFLLYRTQTHELFERYGTNEAGFDVLATLRRSGPEHRLTAGQLAKQCLVTTGGVALRVNRLDTAGLVSRERDAEDARVVYVSLTDKGRQLVDDVADAHFRNEAHMLDGLPPEKQAILAELLRDLERALRSVEPPTEDGEPAPL
ncbi:MarR family winged helix-turn-helix transcriptional regulator [Hoyosella altamirensis]|uniref:DNA-binding MarR family transcriptional regulator n=1 Tax=Hoyosella altamirensis TaxID=616997 RepID=A0A839RL58_9ACTN|nr:MarR family transcriptional regulator [Hoyosella altamirensis]MBB3036793.1 DNA-binding MarR family transcriptional regulator [Hoyosella altamirensis]